MMIHWVHHKPDGSVRQGDADPTKYDDVVISILKKDNVKSVSVLLRDGGHVTYELAEDDASG